MEKVVVFGGTGFIGEALVEHLAQRGADVLVISRSPPFSWRRRSNVTWCTSPTHASPEEFAASLDSSPLIFNLAALSGPADSNLARAYSLDGNCRLQCDFLEGCALTGNSPHVIFTSTRLVYGHQAVLPINEGASLSPCSFYAAHKLCVENYHRIGALLGEIRYTICRISNPYGPVRAGTPGFNSAFAKLLHSARLRKPLHLYGSGEQLRDYIHVTDVVQALLACATSPEAVNQTLNVGCGSGVTLASVMEKIALCANVPVISVPWPKQDCLIESGSYVADISKLRACTGFVPQREILNDIGELVRHPEEVSSNG